MWQVALDAADGCERSMAIWADYVRAAKGRRWLSTSQGLWDEYGINDRTDEEIAEDEPDDQDPVAFLNADVYTAGAKSEAPVLTEVRHLVEAKAPIVVLALVLTRRLGRTVEIERRAEDEGVPTLVWASPGTARTDE